jgi:hypothetical protein
MALKSGFGEAGFDLYCDWAAKSSKFDGKNIRAKWKTIKAEGSVTLGTLFFMARQHGWRDVDARETERRTAAAGASVRDLTDDVKAWPVLGTQAALGLIGEVAKLATAQSEADPVAVMMSTVVGVGALFGRNRYLNIGDDEHHPRHYVALVGESSFARKGTSLGASRKILRATELQLHQLNGGSLTDFKPRLKISFGPMSTGEGIINAIRDARSPEDTGRAASLGGYLCWQDS